MKIKMNGNTETQNYVFIICSFIFHIHIIFIDTTFLADTTMSRMTQSITQSHDETWVKMDVSDGERVWLADLCPPEQNKKHSGLILEGRCSRFKNGLKWKKKKVNE